MASGSLMIGIEVLTRAQLRAKGTLPASFGWLMLISSTFLSLMIPVTGMWAVVAQSMIAIMLSRRDAARDVLRALPHSLDV